MNAIDLVLTHRIWDRNTAALRIQPRWHCNVRICSISCSYDFKSKTKNLVNETKMPFLRASGWKLFSCRGILWQPCVPRVAALLSSASGSVVHESAALIPSAERRTEHSTAHAQGRTARCLEEWVIAIRFFRAVRFRRNLFKNRFRGCPWMHVTRFKRSSEVMCRHKSLFIT